MLQQNSIQEQVIVRAMKDEAFRQELLSSPKGVLEHELGITFPQGVTIQIHEDTSTTRHLVLPEKVPTGALGELSDAELEQAVGFTGGVDTPHHPCTGGACTHPSPECKPVKSR